MNKFFSIIVLILVSSCGFEPIYIEKQNKNISIKTVKFIGEQNININISRLAFPKIDGNSDGLQIELNSAKTITATSKDTSGKITKYRLTINTALLINRRDGTTVSKLFTKSFTYNNRENKFELLQFQRNVENNLINQISVQIRLFLDTKDDN
tara:strand:+ start:132 stop:590 length:459 start_codon:yes stop_codon:yes gene_type:complete